MSKPFLSYGMFTFKAYKGGFVAVACTGSKRDIWVASTKPHKTETLAQRALVKLMRSKRR